MRKSPLFLCKLVALYLLMLSVSWLSEKGCRKGFFVYTVVPRLTSKVDCILTSLG